MQGAIYRLTLTSNGTPAAQNGSITTDEDTATLGQLAATDPDLDALTFSIVADGTLGSATVTDAAAGTFIYTPNANANGQDTFTFKANDGTADSNVATVTVTITPVNDTPIALDSLHPGTEDTPVEATLQASDPDGDPLTFTIDASPNKGTVTITNPATGAFTYVPNANANGVDTFTFTASDGTLTSLPALFTIDVAPVNDPPVAQTGVVTTTESVTVSGQLTATDVDGDPLTFSALDPAGGVVAASARCVHLHAELSEVRI